MRMLHFPGVSYRTPAQEISLDAPFIALSEPNGTYSIHAKSSMPVAGVGFKPTTSGLWAQRADRCPTPQFIFAFPGGNDPPTFRLTIECSTNWATETNYFSIPGEVQTHNRWLRRPLLYSVELQVRILAGPQGFEPMIMKSVAPYPIRLNDRPVLLLPSSPYL